jgi:flagellar hook assembly protein FlgD
VFTWDGRDSAGTLAADGAYVFAVHAESLSAAGVPIPATLTRYATFRLDTTAPIAPVIDPVPAAVAIRDLVVLSIRVVESDSIRIYRNGALVGKEAVGLPTGTTTLHVPVQLLSGANTLTVQALDFAGNVSPISAPVTVRFETPIGFHAPERFTTGDVFTVNLGSSGSSIVIDLFTLKGDPVRQLTSTSSATHYELPWDLKDTRGGFVGDGPYVARLRVGYANGVSSETRAAIVVVK